MRLYCTEAKLIFIRDWHYACSYETFLFSQKHHPTTCFKLMQREFLPPFLSLLQLAKKNTTMPRATFWPCAIGKVAQMWLVAFFRRQWSGSGGFFSSQEIGCMLRSLRHTPVFFYIFLSVLPSFFAQKIAFLLMLYYDNRFIFRSIDIFSGLNHSFLEIENDPLKLSKDFIQPSRQEPC